jgi:hypothetical protein
MSELNFNNWNPNPAVFNSSMGTDAGLNLNFQNFGQIPVPTTTSTMGLGQGWMPDAGLTQWGETALNNWGMNGAGAAGNGDWFSLGSALGKMTPNGFAPGWGMQGLQALGGVMGAWNGMQQLNLAKDQFAFSKQAYKKNYENQKKLTNSYLRDRQARRIREGSAQGSVDDYMNQNGIK